jgi:flavin-dependent dehydrogenase
MSVWTLLRPTKCCGGLLAPDAQQRLARLGLSVPEHVLAGPQLFAVRTMDLRSGRERFYQRHYINIDREKFDRHTVSLLPAEVELRCDCRVRACEPEGDGFRIRYEQDGRSREEHAQALIGADGADSIVRRLRPARGSYLAHRYIAVQEWFPVVSPPPYYGAMFDPEVTDFYGWTIPKGGFMIVGAALAPGRDVRARFERFKDKLAAAGFPLGEPMKREGGWLQRPVSRRDVDVGGGNLALVGEAAGFISPSSAEGISYALASAEALAEALAPGIQGFLARYRRNTFRLRANLFLKRLKSPAMYRPAFRNLVLSGVNYY